MAKKNRGGTQADAIGSKRQNFRSRSAWTWVKERRPDVAKAIIDESCKKYPRKRVFRFNSRMDISMLPK